MNTPEEVGARLRYLRTKKGMKIRAVAIDINISYSQYYEYEHGALDPPTHMVGVLCDYYGVDANWLLGIGGKNAQKATF